MSDSVSGRCLCGAVRFQITGAPRWVAFCHCESCRRSTGAPVTTYLGLSEAQLSWTDGEPRRFESSPGVWRGFCDRCGSPLTYAADRWPGEVHVHVSATDTPSDFVPSLHVFDEERLPWFEVHDALPRYRTLTRGVQPQRVGPAAGEEAR